MTKIDTHNHPDYCGKDFSRIIADMNENGIDRAWLLSWESPVGEFDPATAYVTSAPLDDRCAIPFSRCWDYKQRAPERFILGYAPDPRLPDALQKMRAAVETYHVQVCGEMKFRMMYDNPDAIDLYRFCGENGLPVVLHFDNAGAQMTGTEFPRRHWWYGGDIDTLERVLRLCPETNFLGHAPGFWCHISNDRQGETTAYPQGPVIPGGRVERLLDTYPNLFCDCSAGSCLVALRRDPDYTRKLISAHPDRFLFARDNFSRDLDVFLHELSLPADVLEAVFHGNAERLAAPERG